jgi:hypothetical protein
MALNTAEKDCSVEWALDPYDNAEMQITDPTTVSRWSDAVDPLTLELQDEATEKDR